MDSRYLSGLALGVLIGFLLSTGVLWLLGEEVFLNHHAALFVSVFVAMSALYGISRQIQSNFDLAERNRQAQLDAAKSTLPMVLSNIHRMCENRYNSASKGEKKPNHNPLWVVSDFEISTLKECVQYAEGNEKAVLQHIIRIYQVLVARWDGLELTNLLMEEQSTNSATDWRYHNQYVAILNWATLQAFSDSLFSYARGESSSIDLNTIKSNVFEIIDRIGVGHLTRGGSGYLLINHREFSKFMELRKAENRIQFIDYDLAMTKP